MNLGCWLAIAVSVFSVVASAGPAAVPSAERSFFLDLKVIGHLGLPLGTPVEIVATIADGATLGDKLHEFDYLLRVEAVAGRRLARPRLMEFEDKSLRFPQTHRELYEQRLGPPTRGISDQEMAPLQKDYVGKRVTLLVYETGAFDGIPYPLPPDVVPWQGTGFGFKSRIAILKQAPDRRAGEKAQEGR